LHICNKQNTNTASNQEQAKPQEWEVKHAVEASAMQNLERLLVQQVARWCVEVSEVVDEVPEREYTVNSTVDNHGPKRR
jgi:hypothetical protein